MREAARASRAWIVQSACIDLPGVSAARIAEAIGCKPSKAIEFLAMRTPAQVAAVMEQVHTPFQGWCTCLRLSVQRVARRLGGCSARCAAATLAVARRVGGIFGAILGARLAGWVL